MGMSPLGEAVTNSSEERTWMVPPPEWIEFLKFEGKILNLEGLIFSNS